MFGPSNRSEPKIFPTKLNTSMSAIQCYCHDPRFDAWPDDLALQLVSSDATVHGESAPQHRSSGGRDAKLKKVAGRQLTRGQTLGCFDRGVNEINKVNYPKFTLKLSHI